MTASSSGGSAGRAAKPSRHQFGLLCTERQLQRGRSFVRLQPAPAERIDRVANKIQFDSGGWRRDREAAAVGGRPLEAGFRLHLFEGDVRMQRFDAHVPIRRVPAEDAEIRYHGPWQAELQSEALPLFAETEGADNVDLLDEGVLRVAPDVIEEFLVAPEVVGEAARADELDFGLQPRPDCGDVGVAASIDLYRPDDDLELAVGDHVEKF